MESNFQETEYLKEYLMHILSIRALLMEQVLHCLKIWGLNRRKKVKFSHPETSCYYKLVQNTDLFDNDFPAKFLASLNNIIFSIEFIHQLINSLL